LLRSLRGERVDYTLLIGEGIDNAFDANASRVHITIDADEIRFEDDGVGVTKEFLPALFSLGDHGHLSSTKLGRFGIGIKAQAVNAGSEFSVESVSRDGKFKAYVNWERLMRSGKWTIPDPQWLPVAVGTATGTVISITDLRKAPLYWGERLFFETAMRFHPALVAGKVIKINRQRVIAIDEPALSDIVEADLSFGKGKGAQVRAGVLVGQSKLHHVHVGYEHRVIMPESSLGCGTYSGLNRMFARVQLTGPWRLARFKNDLVDDAEREELDEALAEVLKPILEKCNSQTMTVKIIHLRDALNDMIPEQHRGARPKKLEKPGIIIDRPKRRREPGEIDPDKSEDEGPARTKRPPRDRLIITFDGVADEDGIGAFQAGRPHRVNLSKDHPDIASLMSHRDQTFVLRSLYIIAIMLFLEGLRNRAPGQLELELNGGLGLQVAHLLGMNTAELSDETKP